MTINVQHQNCKCIRDKVDEVVRTIYVLYERYIIGRYDNKLARFDLKPILQQLHSERSSHTTFFKGHYCIKKCCSIQRKVHTFKKHTNKSYNRVQVCS